LKTPDAQAEFADLRADMGVVVAYGLILPQAVLDAPKHGCLNIHASLLPRWRGAAPIQRAIMAGDTETGGCIMQMAAGLDTGPVLLRRKLPIGVADTAADLHDRLSVLGADCIIHAVAHYAALIPEPQPDQGVTYASKINKAEAQIDWDQPAKQIDRQIRGLSPFPGAWTLVKGKRVKILRSAIAPDAKAPPGTVLPDGCIACGQGAVAVIQVQPEGKGPMGIQDYLRGLRLQPGDTIGKV
jgi:methionyl-tRNA formyltransferase